MNTRFFIWSTLAMASTVMADATDDVRCYEIRFSQSVETQNAELFESLVDTDARFVSGSGSVSRGPKAVATAWSIFFTADGPSIKWRPQIVEVLQDGALALSRGPYKLITKDEKGTESEHWGTFNSIWRLQDDGSWKVVFDAGSPAATAPPEEIQVLLDQSDTCSEE